MKCIKIYSDQKRNALVTDSRNVVESEESYTVSSRAWVEGSDLQFQAFSNQMGVMIDRDRVLFGHDEKRDARNFAVWLGKALSVKMN